MDNCQTENTIAIPTYNCEKFIKSTIESILNQSSIVKEIIISDDNSNDGTLLIIENLMISDQRIKIFKNENNLGYQKNWNKCFEYCDTNFLVILHQVDLLKKDAIKCQLNFLKNNSDFALVGD